MKAPYPACPVCRDSQYVRTECIISGRRVTQAYYCGRCDREWLGPQMHDPERRLGNGGDRRKMARAALRQPRHRQRTGSE